MYNKIAAKCDFPKIPVAVGVIKFKLWYFADALRSMTEETRSALVGGIMKPTAEQSTAIGAVRNRNRKPSDLKGRYTMWIQGILLQAKRIIE